MVPVNLIFAEIAYHSEIHKSRKLNPIILGCIKFENLLSFGLITCNNYYVINFVPNHFITELNSVILSYYLLNNSAKT